MYFDNKDGGHVSRHSVEVERHLHKSRKVCSAQESG
jgi:hypothetical protein